MQLKKMVTRALPSSAIASGLAGIAIGLCLGCSVSAVFTPVHLESYHGDGVITKVRDFRTPGAQVDFESFSLQEPYHKSYDLAGLPARPISYTIQLHVQDVPQFTSSKQGMKIGAEGTLTFELTATSGAVMFRCQGSPEQIGWGQRGSTALGTPCNFREPHTDWAGISPEWFKDPSRIPGTLKVEWVPSASAPDLKAHVVMKSGGTC